MRRSIYAVAAVAGSFTLVAGVVAAPSSAYTQKELSVCWANSATSQVLDLEVVADGPSFKSFSMDDGECIAWDVRPGQYQFTVEDVDEFKAGMVAACPGKTPSLQIRIKRAGDSYKAYNATSFLNGSITTNVKKDRRTGIAAELKCI